MSQVIIKYQAGGSFKPIQIKGKWYSPDVFRESVMEGGRKLVQNFGFDGQTSAQYLKDLDEHIDKILNGTMTVNADGTITNTDNSWSNTGEFITGKKLSDSDLRNNRSIRITNLINGMIDNNDISTYKSPTEKYVFSPDKYYGKEFKDYAEEWNNQDEANDKGQRAITNRAIKLASLIGSEADKIEKDESYRNKFNYGDDYSNWDNRYKSTVDNLRKAQSILGDGVLTNDEKLELLSLGIDVDKYLAVDDAVLQAKLKKEAEERKKKEEQDKAAKAQAEQEARDKAMQEHPNGFENRPALDFSKPTFWWDGVPYDYNSPEYIKLLEDNSDARSNVDSEILNQTELDPDNAQSSNYYNLGYRYIRDISHIFSNLNGKRAYIYRKDVLDPSESQVIIEGAPYKIYQQDGKYLAKRVGTDRVIDLGTYTPTDIVSPIYFTKAQNILSNKDFNNPETWLDFYDVLDNNKKQALWKDIQKIYEFIRSGKNLKDTRGNLIFETFKDKQGNNVIRLKIKNRGTADIKIKKPTGAFSADNIISITKIPKDKEGGIIKAQAGVKTRMIEPQPVIQQKQEEEKAKAPLAASWSDDQNYENEMRHNAGLTKSDMTRLYSATADLVSAVGGFIPGLNVASTVVGVGSSLGEYGADLADIINDREGSQNFWQATGELITNLGMDAVSLIPSLKAIKGTKALKAIASYAPHIMGAIQTSRYLIDDTMKASLMNTWDKIAKLDLSSLNTNDFNNLAFTVRTLLGVKGLKNQVKDARSNYKAKNTKTGKVTVEGTVNGEKISTQLDYRKKGYNKSEVESAIKSKYKKDIESKVDNEIKEGTLKLEEGQSKDDIVKDRIKDLEVKITSSAIASRYGLKQDREDLRVESTPEGPKKAFEGWFGSEGKNWWISDYNISRNNRFWARRYGTEAELEAHQKQKEEDYKKYLEERRNRRNNLNNSDNSDNSDNSNRTAESSNSQNSSTQQSETTNRVSQANPNRDAYQKKLKDLISRYNKNVKGNDKFKLSNDPASSIAIAQQLRKSISDKESIKILKQIETQLRKAIKDNTLFKQGGIIRKFNTGGSTNYLDWQNNLYTSPTTFFEVNGITPNQTFSGWTGNSNTVTYNQGNPTLNYPEIKYNDQHISQGDMRTLDVINERDNYYKSNEGHNIFGDVNRAYESWKKSNPNGSLYDFINFYNNSVSSLRGWSSDKATKSYGTKGQTDMNQLFNQIYGSYTVGYDPNQEDILGGGTYRRVPNQFSSLDEYKDLRQGEVGGIGLWLDNAGYLRTGNYGGEAPKGKNPLDIKLPGPPDLRTRLNGNPGNPGNKELKGKEKEQIEGGRIKLNPSDLLSLASLASGIIANNRAHDYIMKMQPAHVQAPWINRYIQGNYPAVALAHENAGHLNTQASTPISSSAELNTLTRLSANARGKELINAGNQQNFETYWRSREGVQQANEFNEQAAVSAANQNNQLMTNMKNAKLQATANKITGNVAGNVKPFIDEKRAELNQLAALAREQRSKREQAMLDIQYKENYSALQDSYITKAKAALGEDKIEGKTDTAILNEYFTSNPEAKKQYERDILNLQKQNLEKSMQSIYDNDNYGLFYREPTKVTTRDYYGNLSTQYYKKGGNIQDKILLQNIKDNNKARLEAHKQSFKNIMDNLKEFNKLYRHMSAGALSLLKKSTR